MLSESFLILIIEVMRRGGTQKGSIEMKRLAIAVPSIMLLLTGAFLAGCGKDGDTDKGNAVGIIGGTAVIAQNAPAVSQHNIVIHPRRVKADCDVPPVHCFKIEYHRAQTVV